MSQNLPESTCAGVSFLIELKPKFFIAHMLTIVSERIVIQREKAPSNKAPTLLKSVNMGIWVVGISNQLFIRGS